MEIYFNHNSKEYLDKKVGKNNGAYWYSKELCQNILPYIKSERKAVTVNVEGCADHGNVIFVHSNVYPYHYLWLQNLSDLILVCSKIETVIYLAENLPMHHVIYIPLSIDTKKVKRYRTSVKDKEVCYAGRPSTKPEYLKKDIECLSDKSRTKFLSKLSHYKKVYATGRCLLEAKCLGCETVNTSAFKGSEELLDNKEVIPMLQKIINEIDGVK